MQWCIESIIAFQPTEKEYSLCQYWANMSISTCISRSSCTRWALPANTWKLFTKIPTSSVTEVLYIVEGTYSTFWGWEIVLRLDLRTYMLCYNGRHVCCSTPVLRRFKKYKRPEKLHRFIQASWQSVFMNNLWPNFYTIRSVCLEVQAIPGQPSTILVESLKRGAPWNFHSLWMKSRASCAAARQHISN